MIGPPFYAKNAVIVGSLFILASLWIVGLNAGVMAESPADLELSEQVELENDAKIEHPGVMDPAGKFMIQKINANENYRIWFNTHILKPLLYGGLNYVSEPVASMVYKASWVPLIVWKGFGWIWAILPIGYAGHMVKDQVRGYINV